MFKYFQAFQVFKQEQALGATWDGKGDKKGGTAEATGGDAMDENVTENPLQG